MTQDDAPQASRLNGGGVFSQGVAPAVASHHNKMDGASIPTWAFFLNCGIALYGDTNTLELSSQKAVS
jgi:hypothetical protein